MELQVFYLERLGYLSSGMRVWVSWTPEECRLVDHALIRTYRDCEAVGLTPVARAEMRRV